MKAKFNLGTIILVLLAVALSPVSPTMAAGSPQDENPPGQIEPLVVTPRLWLPLAYNASGTTPPPPPGTIQSDEFNAETLDPIWTWVPGPEGVATSSVDGSRLRINIPGGVPHIAWRSTYTTSHAARIVQSVANPSNFTLEAKFDVRPRGTYAYHGIRVEHDDNDFLRYEFYSYTTNSIFLYAATIIDGTLSTVVNTEVTANIPGEVSYLRLMRTGSTYTMQYSADGITWFSPPSPAPSSFTFAPAVTKVGLYAGTSYDVEHGALPTSAPAFGMRADYFHATIP